MALIPLVLLVIALLLASRAVRALERRSGSTAELDELRERIRALEDTTAAQEQALHRLTEGQEFTERLLAERSGEGTAPGNRKSTT